MNPQEGSSDPTGKRTGYYPWWLDKLADDVTGEGAAMQGTRARRPSEEL